MISQNAWKIMAQIQMVKSPATNATKPVIQIMVLREINVTNH